MSRFLCAAAAAAALSLGGCSSTTNVEDGRFCDGPVQVTVAGTAPRISWAPSCGFRQLRIVAVNAPSSGPFVRWQIDANSRLIFPDLGYGDVPTGVQAVFPPTALIAGETYQLTLVPVRPSAPTISITWTP
jgi:hypothetical protein